MAFSRVGSIGSVNNKVSSTTLVLTTNADAYAGDLVVVATAWDNNNASSTVGPYVDQLMVEDSVGNLYFPAAEGVRTGGNANLGAHGGIFLCVLQTDLPSGSTITLTYVSARTAKSASAERFTIDSTHVRIAARTWDNGNADPAAISLASLTDQEYLFIYAMASEGVTGDSYTPDADYTGFTTDGSSGSTQDTNMTIRAGSRILTGTGDTVDVSATSRDHVQLFVALAEYNTNTPDAPGGTTCPLVDNFNRANQTPLSGSGWSTLGTHGVVLASNQCQGNGNGNTAASKYTSVTYDADCIVALKLNQIGGQANPQRWGGVVAHASADTGASWDGYIASFIMTSTGGLNNMLHLDRVTDNATTELIHCRAPYVVGDYVAFKSQGDYVELWLYDTSASKWWFFGAVSDTTYRSGVAGISVRHTSTIPTTLYLVDDWHAADFAAYVESGNWASMQKVIWIM